MISIDSSNMSVFITSKVKVREVFKYEDGKRSDTQSRDEVTGLPLYSFSAELITVGADGEENVEEVTVKIAAKDEPVLKPRTQYGIAGQVDISTYVRDNRVAYSLIVREPLVSSKPAAPTLGK